MSSIDWREVAPSQVDPNRLGLLLSRNGWRLGGGQPGLYARWVLEEDRGSSHRLLVPLDPQRADYEDLLGEAIAELGSMPSEYAPRVGRILSGLARTPGDEVRFRKVATTVRGAIPWPTGEELVVSSRNALLAAAKSKLTKMPYYGSRGGQFAHRYLQSVLMGQTEVGSYIVVAYTPIEENFYEKVQKPGEPSLPNIGAHSGRDITRSLVGALEATEEAVEHYRARESLEGFEDGVRRGISREFTEAIKGLVDKADGAEVVVQLTEEQQLEGLEEPLPDRSTFKFSADIQPVLEKAIARLRSMTPPERVTATGWVSVVERPKRGAPGVVRLKVLAGSDAPTIRVRLTEDQFDVAAEAIKAQQVLSVSGRQEKDGGRYWLYDANDLVAIEAEPRPEPSPWSNPDQPQLTSS